MFCNLLQDIIILLVLEIKVERINQFEPDIAGCQGNDNRFNSLEECVNLCGGYEPQEKLDCSAAMCNKQDAAFHRAKGCQPIIKLNEVIAINVTINYVQWMSKFWTTEIRTDESSDLEHIFKLLNQTT